MSDGAPRVPAEPWWIMMRAFGSAKRFPAAPPARIIAAADMPMPTADGRDVGLDVLHDVVDGHAGVGHAAGGVDVEVDVPLVVLRLEEQHLGDDQVRHLVVDLLAQEHDPLAQQLRVDVEGAVAPVALLDHGGDEDLAQVAGRAWVMGWLLLWARWASLDWSCLVLPTLYQM